MQEAGSNAFTMSPSRWIETTGAIGICATLIVANDWLILEFSSVKLEFQWKNWKIPIMVLLYASCACPAVRFCTLARAGTLRGVAGIGSSMCRRNCMCRKCSAYDW